MHTPPQSSLRSHSNAGVLRYFTVQNALVDGKFPVARFLVAGIAFVLGILVTIVFGVLVSGAALRG